MSQKLVKNVLSSMKSQPLIERYISNFNIDLVLQYPHHASHQNSMVFDSMNSLICEVLTWYFGEECKNLRLSDFFAHEEDSLKQSHIFQAYEKWLKKLTSAIDAVLGTLDSSLSELVDNILLHCKIYKELHQVALDIDKYLHNTSYNYGFEHYVAQMREVYIVSVLSFLVTIFDRRF